VKISNYPLWLENWWVEHACRHYGTAKLEDCAGSLRRSVQRLSDQFKADHKSHFPDYQSEAELTLAYGLFYFPQSFLRIQFPLMEILESGWNPPDDRPIRILDLGAGLGAAGFGAASLLKPKQMEGWALDHSEEALRIHEELSATGPVGHWHQSRIDLHQPRTAGLPRMDLILLSFTLTEMMTNFETALDFWLRKLHPKGALLVLEPFSKPSSFKLKKYRDRLLTEKKYHLLAPDSHLGENNSLPQKLFARHKNRTWELPLSMLLLNRDMNRIVDELSFTFLAITPEPPLTTTTVSGHFHLMTPFMRAKGKWIAEGLSSDGVRHQYEILIRHVTPALKRELQKLKAGDSVNASNVQRVDTRFRFDGLNQD
jgi:SAM-dependent methyltransferase